MGGVYMKKQNKKDDSKTMVQQHIFSDIFPDLSSAAVFGQHSSATHTSNIIRISSPLPANKVGPDGHGPQRG